MRIVYKKILLILAVGMLVHLHIYATENKKKILYVDSYNANLWSATIEKGIHSILDKHENIELRIFRMDTKRNKEENFKKNAALKAKQIIDEWKPDIVIASDDNAAKYLIVPYLMNSEVPVVFCGINYDASKYGFPTNNITGMVEVMLTDESLNIIKKYTKGNRMGFLGADNLTTHNTYNYLANAEKRPFTAVKFVNNFKELKKAFIDIQKEVDLLLFFDAFTVEDFDINEMIEFVKEETIVPTFGSLFLTIKHSLLGTPKIGEEHGEWSATKALEILNGKKPNEIPIEKNKKAKLYLNMPIAKKLGIKFPIDLLDNSYLIHEKDKKILFINLYQHECLQNNATEKGLVSSLNLNKITETDFDNTESDVEFKYYKKNTFEISNKGEIDIIQQQIKKIVKSYKPDVIIAINNDAFKRILKNANTEFHIPLILCNTDISISILNNNNHIELPLHDTYAQDIINFAKKFTNGSKLGFIGYNTESTKNLVKKTEAKLNIKFSKGCFVPSFSDLKKRFKALQDELDIICFFEICQLINSTNEKEFLHFFLANTKIPTIDFSSDKNEYSLLGINKLNFEQGIVAAKTAIQLISNNTINNIELLNDSPHIYLNNSIIDKLNITPLKATDIN